MPLVAATLLALVLIHFPGLWLGQYPGPFAHTQTDVVFTFEPYKLSTLEGLFSGEAFWWNDKASLGSPLVLPLGIGILHPFHLFNFIAEPALAYALGLCARLFIFLFFIYLYLTRIGIAGWIAFMAAVGLSFGNWNINYSQQVIGYTMCFFPMALWSIECYAQQHKARHLMLLAAALTLMVLGAFPSLLMYAWMVLASYAAVRVPKIGDKIRCSIPFVLATVLCAPLLWETIAFFRSFSIDMAQRKALFDYIPPASTALTFFFPSVHGGFAEHFPVYGQRDFFGTKLGAGLLIAPALAMALIFPPSRAMLRQQTVVFWIVCVLLCFCLYFNVFDIRAAVTYIPLLKDHPLTRLQAFIAFGGAVLSALFLQHILESGYRPRHRVVYVLPTLLLIILLAWVLRHHSSHYVTVFGWMGVTLCASLSAYAYGFRRLGALVSCLLVLAASVYSSSIYVGTYQRESFYPKSPLIDTIKKKTVPGGRVLDVNDRLFSMRHAAYGVSSITGHYFTPPAIRQVIQKLGTNEGFNGLSYSTVTDFDHKNSWPLLRKFHVQFVILPNEQATFAHSSRSSDFRVVESHDGLTLIEVLYQGSPIEMSDGFRGDGYHRFTQSFGRASFFATSNRAIDLPIRMYRGWRVLQGGEMLPPGPLDLIRVRPSGPGPVHLEYRPAFLLMWESWKSH